MLNQMKTALLLGALSVLLVMLGGSAGSGGLAVGLGFALLMNLGAYFFSDKIVLRMHRAREVSPEESPRLHRIVDDLVSRAGIPKPRIFIIPEAQPNAFATGRNPKHAAVAATEGILRLLDDRELRGVMAHELAHVANRDILVATIAAAIAAAVTYIANMLQWTAMFAGRSSDDEEGGSPWGALLFAFIAPLAATLIQLAISRSREYLADESAARLTQDPEALARALEKLQYGAEHVPTDASPATASLFIVSPLAGRGAGLMSWFSTHPPMDERVQRLRALSSGRRLAA